MISEEIQSNILAENWLDLVANFSIENSNLSENNKIVATFLLPIILEEKEKSLSVPLLRYLIEHIALKYDFVSTYDNLPQKLVEDAFCEINNERGLNLERKLHSLCSEFYTYQDLCKKGYKIIDSTRTDGSCDLVMSKDNINYNFEVKFKESPDIGISRLYGYINGYSLLLKNSFLRGKTFGINVKVESLNYDNLQSILEEVDIFISKKEDIYDGQYLQIFDPEKSIDSIDFDIKQIEDVENLINNIFIKNNGHLTKLINKSRRYESKDNFTGCLVWSIPFHNKINNEKIEQTFKNLHLNFDLFVYTGCFDRKEFNFFVPRKV